MEHGKLTKEEKRWIAWLLTTASSFAILETYAIRNKKHHATLTYTLRKQLGIYPVRPWKLAGTGVVVGFSLWFAVHIITGGLVPKGMRTLEEIINEIAGEDLPD